VKHDHHSLSQLTMISDLRKAMESDQLMLYYQPKVDMASGELCGAEALIRWQHPERGFMPPDSFIPIAEQSGFIVPLSAWVLNAAIRECAGWHRRGIRIPVAVNISARNLQDPNITDVVLNTLEQHALDYRALIIEVTETAVMSNPELVLEIVSALENKGVRVSIDDFGTGYSSLANLKKLPVTEIKIDRSFVMDMKEDNNDAVIVRSTIDLAHNMSLKVTAEGVENQETWDLLRSHGCDQAQGYFISRPIPAADFLEWAEKSISTARVASN
jgi:EAL domain-containing protein (putative c-di-GMP-specific phosphodiesterase class I)